MYIKKSGRYPEKKTGLHTLLDKKKSPGRLPNGGFVNLNFVKFFENDLESLDRHSLLSYRSWQHKNHNYPNPLLKA